jgi:NADH:ubiquinone oxidoreductase subunit
VLDKIFTWWSGATLGVLFTIRKNGVYVGEDSLGNRYYEARDTKNSYDGRKRRWVTYRGYAEATKVPAEWHGWLHHTFEEPPTVAPLKVQSWEKPHLPNLTGTPYAYRPAGSILKTGEHAPTTGDYQAWTPE